MGRRGFGHTHIAASREDGNEVSGSVKYGVL